MVRGRRIGWIAVAGAVAVAALPPAGAQAAAEVDVTISRTSQGIPHIRAANWYGIGYGYGYAIAQDNVCELADTYVTVSAQRSRFFGPEGSYQQRGNGTTVNNLNSDFFFQRAIDQKVVEGLLAKPPPQGPRPEVRELASGYTAGYNRYLADTGVDKIPDSRCRGKDWVRPIEELDVYRRFYQLGILASSGVALDSIGASQPPPPGATGGAPNPSSLDLSPLRDSLLSIGSNAYGLGKDATATGRGMLLGNPHFPWDGPERFYQAQLTIPGKLDVAGGSLFGVPLVLIGSTRGLAWSHTVSTAFRFTPYQLTLAPGSPTTYLVDGQPRQMERDNVTVTARAADGQLEKRSRTLYSTMWGPMFTSIVGIPLPWTPTAAFAMGDANAGNFRYLNHFLETNLAQSAREYDAVLRRNQGIPWVNSIAADRDGRAYYADLSVVPNVSDAKAQQCNTPVGSATTQAARLPVLDGSRSACRWDNDPDAIQPGIFGPGKLPSLFRDDYVTNSNDSYWLSNPEQPLEGFARIIGDERTARSLRTRLGLRIVQQRLDGSDGLPGKRFTLAQLQDAMFNNRQYAAELWRDELVEMCRQQPVLPGSSGPVDVSQACPVLAAWDLRDNLDSRGALLFRRFATRALAVQGGPYDTAFDPGDPVNTPRGLRTEDARIRQALADAVSDLAAAQIPFDAPLGDFQFEMRGSERIPIHGGPGGVGVFNAINVPWVAGKGYPDVPHGSSFVQAVQLTDGCPEIRTILSYSQSTNPESPYFADQTRMFSQKRWVDFPFCAADIAADPNLTVKRLTANGVTRMRAWLTTARPAPVRKGAFRVRCKASGGGARACKITARAKRPGGRSSARTSVVGSGRATLRRGAGVVTVRLNSLGRRLLAGRRSGLVVTLSARATGPGGARATTTRAARLVAARRR